MTKHSLRIRFQWVIGFYAVAVIAAVSIRLVDQTNGQWVYATYKDLMPLLIALPAAWLGYCLQRRSSYMQQLRSLWSKLVETIQVANQYTYLHNPTQEQYAVVLQRLSIAIDEIRGVFMNLGERDGQRGLYPFEPIKQIHAAVLAVGFGSNATQEKLAKLRELTFELWRAVRNELLKEFDREQPTYYHSHYASRDHWREILGEKVGAKKVVNEL
ncbi:hypothetical protein LZ009_09955 [Ramlibacter sp. XY19]|uniref:hypothetical protein n=1 Tax=Ramlibacter paludis TaxID=2908000 RepID=UPI0023D9AF9A|nr:hypothetical protein [Ramlibacter paludis]MCG2593103.1 hypothetical protein [Ramlibacter paludis]